MSKGEKNGSDRAHLQILANAFEAVIGAIYLERGFDDARDFIHTHIIVKLDHILETGSWRDPKSHLQEGSQRLDGQTPVYKVLGEPFDGARKRSFQTSCPASSGSGCFGRISPAQ